MIHREKDPTFTALLMQEGLHPYYTGKLDNDWGPKSKAALVQYQDSFLIGDGRWPFIARIVGADIFVADVVMTCFGGTDDPQDDGQTASGVSTKDPAAKGVSLPMDGRMFTGLSDRESQALDGCPIPKMPFHMNVEVIPENGRAFYAPIIDLGPGLQATTNPSEPHAIDATVAVARLIDPEATARDFSARVSFRIVGAARFALALRSA